MPLGIFKLLKRLMRGNFRLVLTAGLTCSKMKGLDMKATVKLRMKTGNKEQGKRQVGCKLNFDLLVQVAKY